MNVAPKALQIGGKIEATFFFRPLLKSTCPDAFRYDAFALSTLYVQKTSVTQFRIRLNDKNNDIYYDKSYLK